MTKKILILPFLFLGSFFYSQAQDSIINQLLRTRQKDYSNYIQQRDSIKVRTWEKVVMLNGLAARVIQSDSILIAACLEQLAAGIPSVREQQLLDTITHLKGRIEYMKQSSSPENDLSPRDYVILLGVSLILILLGIFALILLRKLQKANKSGLKTKEELETFQNTQLEYENKLEEINDELARIYNEREQLLQQITELNRALISEKQNNNQLKDCLETISNEKQEMQNEMKRLKEKAEKYQNLPDESTINEIITENNLLKSENIQLKQQILELQENIEQLKSELLKVTESSDELLRKSLEEREQKYKMELQNAQQIQLQLEDKIKEIEERLKNILEEKDILVSEHNFVMESLSSMCDELERSKAQLQSVETEKISLEEQLVNLSPLPQQIDALNAEIIRWQNENEELKQQIAREIKLRKEIESDIQKIFNRLEGGV
ncbi:MAG TPA: hypothetical protein PK028_06665 [Bacteroidales bacterium]|jgi:uncharacterized protein (DUF3084 family)|nr:hypothetical protein [Bacteroidales bacterium]MDI9573365.1 hypothetical protein [Bacteroidota bacterium]OQC60303.1 MAG: Chromosome partition protein Smc [Bacteroidetes bacterium ADurb.Bin012]MBP9511388.1 hypothetical protein [Bacteroidales bacterium]MBP9587628.1 hypothetical protein [Bacteroidales bacterium]